VSAVRYASLEAVLKFKQFLQLDNKNRLTLDSDVNSSQIQVQIDFKNITLSIGLTNFIRKIKFNIHHCLNLHYMHLTVLCIVFQFECISPIPIVGSSLILRHALRRVAR